MLFAPDRCVFKITVFSCVVVSVFSDGRMGFYRGGWRCCVAGCVAASGCRLYGLRGGVVSFAGVFSRSGWLFFGWGVVCGIRRVAVCGFGAGMRVCYGFVRLR